MGADVVKNALAKFLSYESCGPNWDELKSALLRNVKLLEYPISKSDLVVDLLVAEQEQRYACPPNHVTTELTPNVLPVRWICDMPREGSNREEIFKVALASAVDALCGTG